MLRLLKLRTAATDEEKSNTSHADDDLAGLARRAAARDPAAVRTLIAALGPTMLRAARSVLGRGHPDLDDVLQESAVGLLSALSGFRSDCTVRHFACRV